MTEFEKEQLRQLQDSKGNRPRRAKESTIYVPTVAGSELGKAFIQTMKDTDTMIITTFDKKKFRHGVEVRG